MKIIRKHNILKYWKIMLGLCLITFGQTSCTRDYFVDENNFRLYVPQIEKGEIANFYVAIHDASGRHILTRQISAPFTKDDLMKQGILRFKLPYGENYKISCFADYAADATIPGQSYSDSYLQKTLVNGTNVYASRNTNPRSYLCSATVYPIGHPEAPAVRVVNIDENQRYKGKVKVNFKDMPAMVSRIDIYYRGLATKYNFEGTFDCFAPHDLILASFNVADFTSGNISSFEDLLNPSVGTTPFGVMGQIPSGSTRAPSTVFPGYPLELEMYLYNASGANVGVISFTGDDFQRLKTEDPTKVPTSEDGNELDHLVLESQKTIVFNFEGFTIVNIELVDWGDIIGGGSTPM